MREAQGKPGGGFTPNLLGDGCPEAGEGCPGIAVLSLRGPSSLLRAPFSALVKFSLATAV